MHRYRSSPSSSYPSTPSSCPSSPSRAWPRSRPTATSPRSAARPRRPAPSRSSASRGRAGSSASSPRSTTPGNPPSSPSAASSSRPRRSSRHRSFPNSRAPLSLLLQCSVAVRACYGVIGCGVLQHALRSSWLCYDSVIASLRRIAAVLFAALLNSPQCRRACRLSRTIRSRGIEPSLGGSHASGGVHAKST